MRSSMGDRSLEWESQVDDKQRVMPDVDQHEKWEITPDQSFDENCEILAMSAQKPEKKPDSETSDKPELKPSTKSITPVQEEEQSALELVD